MERRKFIALLGSAVVVGALSHASLAADYKPEFKMSVIVTEDTAWGRAATRFADAVRLRTDGRIKIKNYFGGPVGCPQNYNATGLLWLNGNLGL